MHITFHAIEALCRIEKIERTFSSIDKWQQVFSERENLTRYGPWACGAFSVKPGDFDHIRTEPAKDRMGFVLVDTSRPEQIKVTCNECIKIMKEYGL